MKTSDFKKLKHGCLFTFKYSNQLVIYIVEHSPNPHEVECTNVTTGASGLLYAKDMDGVADILFVKPDRKLE